MTPPPEPEPNDLPPVPASTAVARPSRDPGPLWVAYDDHQGGRPRRHFPQGSGRRVRAFYLAMHKQGRNPRVERADGRPSLVPDP